MGLLQPRRPQAGKAERLGVLCTVVGRNVTAGQSYFTFLSKFKMHIPFDAVIVLLWKQLVNIFMSSRNDICIRLLMTTLLALATDWKLPEFSSIGDKLNTMCCCSNWVCHQQKGSNLMPCCETMLQIYYTDKYKPVSTMCYLCLKLFLKLILNLFISACIWRGTRMEVRGQLAGVHSSFLPSGFQGLNLGPWATHWAQQSFFFF